MRIVIAVVLLLGMFVIEALHQRKLERARLARLLISPTYAELLAKMKADLEAMARLIGEQLVPAMAKAAVELRRLSSRFSPEGG